MTFDSLRTETERFRTLATAQGPFVSVYFDDSRNNADPQGQLEAIWRDLRKQLEDLGADKDMIAVVRQGILDGHPAIGRQGRGIIATRRELLVNEHLSRPPQATIVRMSEYPYVMPLVELAGRHPQYLFAAVDHLGADITIHRDDTISRDTAGGGGYPVHKPATAGWNGYGDVQHSAEEAMRMNVRAVADRITDLVEKSDPELVFVCGEVRARTDVHTALPEAIRKRVVQLHAGAHGHRVREEEIRDRIDEAFRQYRQRRVAEIATRLESETKRHSGFAAEGLEVVCAALREGAVDILVVADLGDATVVTGEERTTIAPDADALSELGEAPRRLVRADEAVPLAAICVGASIIRIDGIDCADGVAALLRYAPNDMPEPGPARESALQ
ncbi:hypothetical protein [Mycobacterium sp. 3519A]|uniref:Rv2629 family ribosome hibernation factor n=1 Tax=Mycobacterium sp. 3519A TaxID=2057184 RepID=UPI000C7A1DED|nr:hypothetical protein [Mycobacterium sp. 3519A]